MFPIGAFICVRIPSSLYGLPRWLSGKVIRLPMQETQKTRSLHLEDPLEKEIATHSSILAWEIPWTEEPGGLQSMGSRGVRHDWAFRYSSPYRETSLFLIPQGLVGAWGKKQREWIRISSRYGSSKKTSTVHRNITASHIGLLIFYNIYILKSKKWH